MTNKDNAIYVNGNWCVYVMAWDGRKHWFVGRTETMGYMWVYPRKKDAIQVCDIAAAKYADSNIGLD